MKVQKTTSYVPRFRAAIVDLSGEFMPVIKKTIKNVNNDIDPNLVRETKQALQDISNMNKNDSIVFYSQIYTDIEKKCHKIYGAYWNSTQAPIEQVHLQGYTPLKYFLHIANSLSNLHS